MVVKVKLNVLVSKTSNGKNDYLQIMSDDYTSVNIVLVAESITFEDKR